MPYILKHHTSKSMDLEREIIMVKNRYKLQILMNLWTHENI